MDNPMNAKSAPMQSSFNSLRTNNTLEHPRQALFFCERVFDSTAQKLYLPKQVIEHLEEVNKRKVRFDVAFADIVAEGLKHWALKHGATHFTHWFQPLTSLGAEKHDSFLCWGPDNTVISRISGKDLLSSEPDASSFPNGGLRATHEARGYTAWDSVSSPFLWESAEGLTLYIPSVFYSWKGVALDQKIPLLRSDQKIESAVKRLLLLCKIKANCVYSTLGAEQEYFLIDQSLYAMRPDLMLAGRTVFGARPAKGQELEDHYLGVLKDKVLYFMRDFEEKALRLGIPIKTKHNEVAPAQHEVTCLFEKASIASDHNLLLMQLMRQSAAKYDLACLFHEKPFAGINGSGKHCNWSIGTDSGLNLFDPKENSLLFLTLLAAVLRAVNDHAALIRASIASYGNDYRLGGSEAPPSILSVYLGEGLEKIIHEIIQEKPSVGSSVRQIDLGLTHLPHKIADVTDRNRTSFFAFTGNKFEFRAVGASDSCAFPIAILNTIVADSLELLLDEIEDAVKEHRDAPVEKILEMALPVLRKAFKGALPVLYGGDNYSSQWRQEADLRGLPNVPSSFHAFSIFREKKTIRVLENVLSEQEIEGRFEVFVEQYAKKMNIEVNLMLELFHSQIAPAVQKDLYRRVSYLQTAGLLGVHSEAQVRMTERVNALLEAAIQTAEAIELLQKQSLELGWEAKAKVCCELMAPKMAELRKSVDALELQVDDDLWPMPKYRELLFCL